MSNEPEDEDATDHAAQPPAAGAEAGTRAARTRVLKGAHAAFNQEFSAIPCQIRNLSDSGARLIFDGGWFVPDRFTLHVDIDGYKRDCERVWHKGSECGVRFTGERIATSRARQQVIAPEAVADVDAPDARAPALLPQAPSPGGRPVRPTGFGRRTR